MIRVRDFVAGAAVAALLTTGTVAMAQGGQGDGPRRGGPGAPFGRFGGPGGPGLPLRELNLTDAQKQQVQDIEARHRDEARQTAERLRTAMTAQRKAIETEPVNDGLIRTATQQLADVQADAAIARAHLRSEILAILTADQKAQLTKLEATHQADGPRPGRGPRR